MKSPLFLRSNLCLKIITCERISVSLYQIQPTSSRIIKNLPSLLARKHIPNRRRIKLISITEVALFVTRPSSFMRPRQFAVTSRRHWRKVGVRSRAAAIFFFFFFHFSQSIVYAPAIILGHLSPPLEKGRGSIPGGRSLFFSFSFFRKAYFMRPR